MKEVNEVIDYVESVVYVELELFLLYVYDEEVNSWLGGNLNVSYFIYWCNNYGV